MRRWIAIVGLAAAAAVLGSAAPAAAGANRCMYNGVEYGEGVVICQAGLLNLCMNGEWQSKGGVCDGTPDGAVVSGAGGAAVAPPPAVEDDD
ncbi:MAG TPA: hypothetical protein VFD92_28540 [Candidatus Binatia bacterium]|nr:hypothetical protein [Candidatus Binatia bacterium]